MTSWVYVFSKFTPEALLFEALTICLICACYAAYWILRKRKLGAVEEMLPSSVVKIYLNELIGDAEQMRAQLFGLLAGAGFQMSQQHGHGQHFIGAPGAMQGVAPSAHAEIPAAQAVAGAPGPADPAVVQKMMSLEAQMASQTKAIESIMLEKSRLEKDLAEAKLNGAAAPAGSGGGADTSDLENKVKDLEGRLAEYAVIEDDLANLKRLQQENAQLKAQLAGKGPAAAAPPEAAAVEDTPPAPEAAAEEEAVASDPVAAGAAEAEAAFAAFDSDPAPDAEAPVNAEETVDTAALEAEAAAIAAAAAPPAPAVPELAASFEALVDKVEESLQPEAQTPAPEAPAAAVAAAPPAASQQSTSPAAPASMEKSDADLVAEFEKMLSG